MTISHAVFYVAAVAQISCFIGSLWALRKMRRGLKEGRAQIAEMDKQIERIEQAEQQYRAAEASFRTTAGLGLFDPHWYN